MDRHGNVPRSYWGASRGGGGSSNRGGGGGGRSYNKQNYRPQFPPQQGLMSYGNVGQPVETVSYVDNNVVGNTNSSAQFVRMALLYPYQNDQPDQFMENPDPAWNTAQGVADQQKLQQQQQENKNGVAGAAGQPCAAPVLRTTMYNPTSAKLFGRLGESHCIIVYVEDSPRVASREKQTTHPTVHVCIYENSTLQWIERTLANTAATGESVSRKSPIAPTLMPDTPVFARLFSPNNPQARSFATGNMSCMPGTRVAILPSKNVSLQYQLTLIQEA